VPLLGPLLRSLAGRLPFKWSGSALPEKFQESAQITDGHGNVLARLAYEDGEGVVTADITPLTSAELFGPTASYAPHLPRTAEFCPVA
jgi:hypothetical protein